MSGFRLDKYLVTVGRFRQFGAAWDNGSGFNASAGSGKHAHLNGGQGLANVGPGGGYEAGWDAAHWDDSNHVGPVTFYLACGGSSDTWTNRAGTQENLPINCVTWWEAWAFCIWDGGFLPSEAEWGYAAAAGSQELEYPWGSTAPGTTNQYAIYNDYYTGNSTDIAPVGYASQGVARWGQLDMAGEVWEWNLDGFATYVSPCIDCANTTAASFQAVRGGCFASTPSLLLPYRYEFAPSDRYVGLGFRCARTP